MDERRQEEWKHVVVHDARDASVTGFLIALILGFIMIRKMPKDDPARRKYIKYGIISLVFLLVVLCIIIIICIVNY